MLEFEFLVPMQVVSLLSMAGACDPTSVLVKMLIRLVGSASSFVLLRTFVAAHFRSPSTASLMSLLELEHEASISADKP